MSPKDVECVSKRLAEMREHAADYLAVYAELFGNAAAAAFGAFLKQVPPPTPEPDPLPPDARHDKRRPAQLLMF